MPLGEKWVLTWFQLSEPTSYQFTASFAVKTMLTVAPDLHLAKAVSNRLHLLHVRIPILTRQYRTELNTTDCLRAIEVLKQTPRNISNVVALLKLLCCTNQTRQSGRVTGSRLQLQDRVLTLYKNGSCEITQWLFETFGQERSYVIEQEYFLYSVRTHFYHDASTHDRFCDRRVVEFRLLLPTNVAIARDPLSTQVRSICSISSAMRVVFFFLLLFCCQGAQSC